jgi:hypothetical protein
LLEVTWLKNGSNCLSTREAKERERERERERGRERERVIERKSES